MLSFNQLCFIYKDQVNCKLKCETQTSSLIENANVHNKHMWFTQNAFNENLRQSTTAFVGKKQRRRCVDGPRVTAGLSSAGRGFCLMRREGVKSR